MKKRSIVLKIMSLAAACMLAINLSAQTSPSISTYRMGGGILIDVGDGGTLVGPHVKYFFDENNAGEAAVLFGRGVTTVQGIYTYNMPFPEVDGLKWNIGAGPAVAFGSGSAMFSILGTIGLEYVIPNAPLALGVDWRPRFYIYDSETYFEAARFGLALRYTFNR